MLNAELISIGDELLIGQVVNTNACFISEQLNLLGIEIVRVSTIGDKKENILSILKEAEERADIIIITGGLGPTKDDITKHTLCEFFKSKLIVNESVLSNLKSFFTKKSREVSGLNKRQAEVPDNCIVLNNEIGTAPGMLFHKDEKIFIALPGVPYEMKYLMQKEVLPRLSEINHKSFIIHKNLLTAGIAESSLSELISDWEDDLPSNFKLAYLPTPGMVKLRLTVKGNIQSDLEAESNKRIKELEKIISKYIVGYETDSLESVIGNLLKIKGLTISTAESCTGGYIAHLITKIPGSSEYYKGSVIAYSYDVKSEALNVDSNIIKEQGAVSEEVVLQMARNIKEKFKTDYSIACSGIAGPGGGTKEKPVGLVWIAVGSPSGMISKQFIFGENRDINIQLTAISALNMLRIQLLAI